MSVATWARAEDVTGPSIYQQRNADGSVLLTDRPAAGAVTQRTWRVAPPDPDATQRREAARQDAAEVTRRIGQRLDADDRRAQELTLARLRAAESRAQQGTDGYDVDSSSNWIVGPRVTGIGRRGNANGAAVDPSSAPSPLTGRAPTARIVRGIPLRADGFPVR